MTHDRNGLDVLDHNQCIELLNTATLGRIGLLVDGLPAVLPVNFRMTDDHVVIRTVRGSKLAAATRHAIVAFEVDGSDPHTDGGWSVMVRGIARETTDIEHVTPPWDAGWLEDRDTRLVTISLDLVSGRRLTPHGSSADLSLSRQISR